MGQSKVVVFRKRPKSRGGFFLIICLGRYCLLYSLPSLLGSVAGGLCSFFGTLCSRACGLFGRVRGRLSCLFCAFRCSFGGMFGSVGSVFAKLLATLGNLTFFHICSETLTGVLRFLPALLHFSLGGLVCIRLAGESQRRYHPEHH